MQIMANALPLEKEQRINLIDSIRGIALFGILLMNMPYFGQSYQASYNLTILNEYSGPNYWVWWIVNGLFEGTMRGLFSMLFGAGALLLLSRLEKKEMEITPADIYYRRLIWLLIFGLINAFIFLWPGDILYTYAITGLFLYPFRKMAPKYLLIFAAAFFFFSTLQHTSKLKEVGLIRKKGEQVEQLEKKHKKLTDGQKEDLKKWQEYQHEHSHAHLKMKVQEGIEEHQGSYEQVFDKMAPVNVFIETKDFYTELFFDALLFFFLGMAFFKMGIITGNQKNWVYALLLFLGYGFGLPLSYYINHSFIMNGFDVSLMWAKGMKLSLYQTKRILLVCGHLSLIVLVWKTRIFSWLYALLASVGQMAFTNYLMQSIICTFIFNGYGLGMFGKMQRYEMYELVVAIWLFQLIFSAVWLRFFNFGPFEWAWRSLTYWKRQPFLK